MVSTPIHFRISFAQQAIPPAFTSCHLQAAPPPGLVGPVGSVATFVVPILVDVRSGLLGGTFDPPHIAHLLAGEVAYRQLGLDRVIYLPAGSPWQKADRKVSSAGDRWRMTEIATAGISYFVPDDREVHRDGWTYTIDTLATFEPSEEIVLILGADAARGLPSWEKADQVLERVRVAVLPRPGTERAEVESAIGAPTWLDMPALPVSGTMIRERFMAGTGVRFLIPDGVYDYMVERALYQEKPQS
ncbi:MAG TPA: nicotinate-nucleotide adenylyltransferase [Acidimicrobiia bacterium]|nr:nicotinate-nucleotide adenylyltransferase [Acidimicrobiia bacterium]